MQIRSTPKAFVGQKAFFQTWIKLQNIMTRRIMNRADKKMVVFRQNSKQPEDLPARNVHRSEHHLTKHPVPFTPQSTTFRHWPRSAITLSIALHLLVVCLYHLAPERPDFKSEIIPQRSFFEISIISPSQLKNNATAKMPSLTKTSNNRDTRRKRGVESG